MIHMPTTQMTQTREPHKASGGTATKAVLAGLLALSMAGCAGLTGSGSGSGSSDQAVSGSSATGSSEAATTGLLRSEAEIPTDGSPLSLIDTTDLWTKRDLADPSPTTEISLSGATATATGPESGYVSVEDGVLTISGEGTYALTGESDGLSIVVDAPEDAKVQLVLSGVSMRQSGYACIYAKSADKLFVTAADGTDNSIEVTGEFAQRDDSNVDGAVFAKCDLTVNGTGRLSVSCESGHGIVCKDDLKLVSSETHVTSGTGHAIQAKDSVSVHGGTWVLDGAKDGIHAENEDKPAKGWVYVESGTITITAGSDGIDANSYVQVDGGSLTIDAGDDGIHAELDLAVNGGQVDVPRCHEGLEGGTVTVTAGDVNVVADDDGFNATGDPYSETAGDKVDGEMPGHDGFLGGFGGFPGTDQGIGDDADGDGQEGTQTNGQGQPDGEMSQPPELPEGQEGTEPPELPGSQDGMEPPEMPDSQDGQNGRGGGMRGPGSRGGMRPQGQGDGTQGDGGDMRGPGDQQAQGDRPELPSEASDSGDGTITEASFGGGRGGMGGGMMMGTDATAILTISGGTVHVDAQGDGLDSNGTIHVTGGETYVFGPVSDGDTALDYGTDLRIDGGTILAVGSSGMVEDVSSESTQPSMTVTFDGARSGAISVVSNADGSTLVTATPSRQYSAATFSSPSLSADGSYTISSGDSTQSVQMSGTVTSSGTRSGSFGGRGGMGGGSGFSRPEDLVGQQMGAPQADGSEG